MEKISLLDIGNVVRDIGFYVLKCCMLNELINFLTMNLCRILLCVVFIFWRDTCTFAESCPN